MGTWNRMSKQSGAYEFAQLSNRLLKIEFPFQNDIFMSGFKKLNPNATQK